MKERFNDGSSFLVDFKPVVFNSKVYNYLVKDRKYNSTLVKNNMYQAKYKITDKWYDDVVVFINTYKDKVFGLQLRNLKHDKKRMFKVYQFSDLYYKIYNEYPDETLAIPYNKLGFFFNVFNVNYERCITVFEGYLDSLLMRNSVGAVGTNTDMDFFINSEIDRRFFFDNDDAGHKKATEYLLKKEKVFLWEKFFNDFAKKSGDYYNNLTALRDIKDLNKLAIIADTEDPESDLKLNDYFSNDIFDLIWIPKKTKVDKRDEIIKSKYGIDFDWSTIKNQLLTC